MRRITKAEIPAITKELMKAQKNMCPICGQSLLIVEAKNRVLDHCHDKGYVRAVLHRGCNGMEGKIKNLMKTWGRSGASELTMIQGLENLAAFWRQHLTAQTEYIHPSHLTGPQRMAIANKEATRISKVLRRKT